MWCPYSDLQYINYSPVRVHCNAGIYLDGTLQVYTSEAPLVDIRGGGWTERNLRGHFHLVDILVSTYNLQRYNYHSCSLFQTMKY